MQPVAMGETVEVDASTVGDPGHSSSSVARATSRFSGWTPSSPLNTAPWSACLPTAGQTVGQPALGTPMWPPLRQHRLGWTPRQTRLPDRFHRPGAGLCPHFSTRAWAPLFSLGRKIACDTPGRSLTVWARCSSRGGGWTPCPTSFGAAPTFKSAIRNRGVSRISAGAGKQRQAAMLQGWQTPV